MPTSSSSSISVDQSGSLNVTGLEAGEEYKVLIRTISEGNLTSDWTNLTQSLPVDTYRDVSMRNMNEIKFDIEFVNGTGGYINYILRNSDGIIFDNRTDPFRCQISFPFRNKSYHELITIWKFSNV